jgi:hypothetical protein
MSFAPWNRNYRRIGACTALCTFAVVGAPSQGSAQQPVPVPAQPSPPGTAGGVAVAAYRVPTIGLAQPSGAALLPQDRPVVVFRFAPGEPNDPIDLASFTVSVDGHDQTRSFQVTASEAWGSLLGGVPRDSSAALGTRQVTARICSARGACGVLVTSLTIVPSQLESRTPHPAAEGAAADGSSSASSRRRRVVDAVLAALRRLLSP